MKVAIPLLLSLFTGIALFTIVAQTQSLDTAAAADAVYINGKVYTVNDAQSWAEAVPIKNGKFLAVGSNAEVGRHRGDATIVVDLGGKATKEWLDPHFPDRAVYVIDQTGHNAVVNSAALKLAGITKETPDPEFGTIDRDPKTGEPTGYLSETGMGLIGKFVRRPDADANYRGISRALEPIRSGRARQTGSPIMRV